MTCTMRYSPRQPWSRTGNEHWRHMAKCAELSTLVKQIHHRQQMFENNIILNISCPSQTQTTTILGISESNEEGIPWMFVSKYTCTSNEIWQAHGQVRRHANDRNESPSGHNLVPRNCNTILLWENKTFLMGQLTLNILSQRTIPTYCMSHNTEKQLHATNSNWNFSPTAFIIYSVTKTWNHTIVYIVSWYSPRQFV